VPVTTRCLRPGGPRRIAGPWTTVKGQGSGRVAVGAGSWNTPCRGMIRITMARPARPSHSLAALAFALALPACDRADDDIEMIVAERTAHSILAQTNLAFTAELFSFPPDLALEDAATARARAVELLRDRVLALPLDCEPELEVGEDSLVARFSECRVGLLGLEGEVEATVDIETGPGPCPSGECPTAVLWTIEDFDVQLGPELPGRPRLSGPVTLRDEADTTRPMSWTTQEGFTLENRFGTFATDSHAAWTLDADGCISFTLESQLDHLTRASDVDVEIGTIVLQAERVHRCPAECPDAGRLRLSYGAGQLLEWNYGGTPGDADEDVEVLAPRGHRFLQKLQCR